MKTSDKNIDATFRALNDLEVKPSARVWEGIEGRLDKKKKRVLPLFVSLGMAASVLLILGLFFFMGDESNLRVNPVVDSSQDKVPDTGQKETGSEYQQPAIAGMTDERESSSESGRGDKGVYTPDDLQKMADRGEAEKDRRQYAETSGDASREISVSRESSIVPPKMISRTFENNLPETSSLYKHKRASHLAESSYVNDLLSENEPEKALIKRRLTLGGEYSPTYSFREVSGPLPGKNTENGLMTSGGGISLAYQVSSRWQIETGVKYSVMGQEVNTVSRSERVYGLASTSAETNMDVTGVQLTNSMGSINRDASPVTKNEVRAFMGAPDELVEIQDSDVRTSENPSLEQTLGYMRIPVTLRYHLFKQSGFDVSFSGGVSTNWLMKNDAYLYMSGREERIGETEGIDDMSLSSHAGVAVAMPIYRGLRFRMEPRVDYFLTDISSASPVRFRPYSFGVFTGVLFEW